MKRKLQLSLVAIGLLMAQLSISQTEVGAKAGATFSDITTKGLNLGKGFLEPQMIAGPTAGLYAEVPLGHGFYFAPELNYSQKGFKVQESMDLDVFGLTLPIGAEAITRLDYIDMPLTLKYKFGGDRLQAYVKAGPTLGYAVSGHVTTRINSIIDIRIAETNLNTQGDLYNAFELGGLVGAGLEVPTASGKFFVDASFSQGFSDILNEPVVDLRVHNRAFGLGIGYAIRF